MKDREKKTKTSEDRLPKPLKHLFDSSFIDLKRTIEHY